MSSAVPGGEERKLFPSDLEPKLLTVLREGYSRQLLLQARCAPSAPRSAC